MYKPLKGQFVLFADCIFELTKTNIKLIKGGELYATYGLYDVAEAVNLPNTVEITIENVNINTTADKFTPLQRIFTMIGMTPPCKLYLIKDDYTSTENKQHISYKIANSSNDTIMYLEQNKIQKPTQKPT
jgi:hypothetical protein